jgi:hypothetical protein
MSDFLKLYRSGNWYDNSAALFVKLLDGEIPENELQMSLKNI